MLITLTHADTFQNAAEDGVLRCQNYGVLSRYQQHITASDDKHIHHLIRDLPMDTDLILEKTVPNTTAHVNA